MLPLLAITRLQLLKANATNTCIKIIQIMTTLVFQKQLSYMQKEANRKLSSRAEKTQSALNSSTFYFQQMIAIKPRTKHVGVYTSK